METEKKTDQKSSHEAKPDECMDECMNEESKNDSNDEESSVSIEDQVNQLRLKAEENYEQFLRARADLENFRRRSRKDMEETVKYASLPLIESLLSVLDNFERALKVGEENKETQTFYEGVDMVYRQLMDALTSAGLSSIESKGKIFDPYEHNAVVQEESSDVEENIILEELQPGYRFKDRVIRPAMVKVSK